MGGNVRRNILVMDQIHGAGIDAKHFFTAAAGNFRHQVFAADPDGDQIANVNITGDIAADFGVLKFRLRVIQHIIIRHLIQMNFCHHIGVNGHRFLTVRSLGIFRRIFTRHANVNSGIGLQTSGVH